MASLYKSRVIAFYLPQYYPTPTNDKWYGKGFTEWTNVGKAHPLFRGHYQPKVPMDLGYYDLRYPEIKEQQAKMAQQAGIEGFCYYHYWFGNGKKELEYPLQEVIKTKKPDYPFCLCWANQSWYSKFWSNDINDQPKLIVEQTYDEKDDIIHFEELIKVFKDDRYITVDGKLLFMIYRPLEFPSVSKFMKRWRSLAQKHGLKDFYFVAQATDDSQVKKIVELGFDGVNISRKDEYLKHWRYNNSFKKLKDKLIRLFGGAPYHYEYNKVSKFFIQENGLEREENIFPTIIPNWDHSPRSGKRGEIFHNSRPVYFKEHLLKALRTISQKQKEHQILFLKSWNEWGEGNYVEPDLKYGHGYLEVLEECLKNK